MCNKVNGVGILKVCNKKLKLKYYMVKMYYSAFYEAVSTRITGMDEWGSYCVTWILSSCFVFYFDLLHLNSTLFCGLALLHWEKKRKSLWYLLHYVGAVDVNVCTLYSTFIKLAECSLWGKKTKRYIKLFHYFFM